MDEPTAADRLVSYLPKFNRKERYYLIRQVLDAENPYAFDFGLLFKSEIEDMLGLRFGQQLMTAVDYHLDWIHACLYLARNGLNLDELPPTLGRRAVDHSDISGTQEDIDMLATFAKPEKDFVHMLMIEAKGTGSWDQKQLKSKVKRFKTLFAEENLCANGRQFVQVYFVFISPEKPSSRDPETAKFLAERTIHLPMTFRQKMFYKTTRCNEQGVAMADGEFWKVLPEEVPGPPYQR